MTRGECRPETGQSLAPLLQPLWREFDVKRAWLFGGRARGEADAGSDWDFLVEFASKPGFANYMGLKCALEDELGAKVDLLREVFSYRPVAIRGHKVRGVARKGER